MDLKPGKKWECPKCSKTFKKKDRLNQHLVTHDPDAKTKCQVCKKIYKNPHTVAVHMRSAHNSRDRPPCNICHRVFYDFTSLRRHMDARHGSNDRPRFPCTFPGCEKTYLNQRNISQHVKTDHVENPVRFPCTLCDKEFKRRANFVLHIPTHTTEKPHNCVTCGRSFANMWNLKSHEETHLEKSERKVLQCNLCPQTFLRNIGRREHILAAHENQRNYRCEVCDKTFFRSGHLKIHVTAVHPANKERIHPCDKCDYRSHSRVNLAKHRRRHDAKKHECYFCAKKFVAFRDLVSHCGHIHTLEKKRCV